jgi:hypothetical protein
LGGEVNVLICDDGLQLISDADRHERLDYYASIPNLGYIARPVPSKLPRRGRFKKGGNLNFSHMITDEATELLSHGICKTMAEVMHGVLLTYTPMRCQLYITVPLLYL